jgi:uncharacterized membrane protein
MQLEGKRLMLYSSGIVALLMFLMFRFLGIFSAIAFSFGIVGLVKPQWIFIMLLSIGSYKFNLSIKIWM